MLVYIVFVYPLTICFLLATWVLPRGGGGVFHRYFGGVGVGVEIVTENIDYFAFQTQLADVSTRLSGFGDDKSPYIQVSWSSLETLYCNTVTHGTPPPLHPCIPRQPPCFLRGVSRIRFEESRSKGKVNLSA